MNPQSAEQSQRELFLASEGDAYEIRNEGVEPDRGILTHLASLLKPGHSVLEIGCGSGGNLRHLEGLVPGISCSGIDPSALAIDRARVRSPHHHLEVGAADLLPFEGPFDVVLFGFCLYLCDRFLLPRIVAEADRVLRGARAGEAGLLAIIDFDPPSPHRRPYQHDRRMFAYKMDYSALFLANPAYRLITKARVPSSDKSSCWIDALDDRAALWVMSKDEGFAYPIF